MTIGMTAPRYEEMIALRQNSKVFRTLGLDYFILVMRLCHEVVTICNRSTLSQLQSLFKNVDITTYKTRFLNCSNSIKAHLYLEEVQENSEARELSLRLSSAELHRRRLAARVSLLEACSSFDYQIL